MDHAETHGVWQGAGREPGTSSAWWGVVDSPQVFSYTAYGLGIRSELPLPELLPAAAAADIVIRVGALERARYGTESKATGQEAYVFWEEAGACLVRHGREIIFDPLPNVEPGIIRLLVLGPALALALQQRGMLVLHASTVEVNDAAVGFLGNSGAGKSTLAAAFCSVGHKMVTDDVTAVDLSTGQAMVFPGFPQMKLWPDTAASLGHDPEALPRLYPRLEKRACRFEQEFRQTPALLKHLYVLADGPGPAIMPLQPQDALIDSVRYSYQPAGLRTMVNAAHFFLCAGLVKQVQVSRLERPRSFAELSAVVRLVEKDLNATDSMTTRKSPTHS